MVWQAVHERWKAADSGTLLIAPSTGGRYGSDPNVRASMYLDFVCHSSLHADYSHQYCGRINIMRINSV